MSNTTGILRGLLATAVFAGALAPLLLVIAVAAGTVLLASASLRLATSPWRAGPSGSVPRWSTARWA